jgi:uncharacterized phage protein (TIGR02220 family)
MQGEIIMKYTIMGFRQEKLVKLGLDIIDATILRYFIDFKESNGMKVKKIEENIYYWLRYDGVLREFPIFNMKKCTVQSRFFKLRDAGVLTHQVIRAGGTYSYFGIGEKYEELVTEDTRVENESVVEGNKEEEIQEKEETSKPKYQWKKGNHKCSPKKKIENEDNNALNYMDENLHHGDIDSQDIDGNSYDKNENSHRIGKNFRGYNLESTTNNPSTKDPSIKINKSVFLQKTSLEIIEYLNLKTGKNFKSTTKITLKLIKARLNEGFTLDDFKTVIDNMKSSWTGTKFQQYLAPTTLFGTKFETYLNQHREEEGEVGFKRGNVVNSDEKSRAELKEKLCNMILAEDM